MGVDFKEGPWLPARGSMAQRIPNHGIAAQDKKIPMSGQSREINRLTMNAFCMKVYSNMEPPPLSATYSARYSSGVQKMAPASHHHMEEGRCIVGGITKIMFHCNHGVTPFFSWKLRNQGI